MIYRGNLFILNLFQFRLVFNLHSLHFQLHLLNFSFSSNLQFDTFGNSSGNSLTFRLDSGTLSLLFKQLSLSLFGFSKILHLLSLKLPSGLLFEFLGLVTRIHFLTLRGNLNSQVDGLGQLLLGFLVSYLLTLDVH